MPFHDHGQLLIELVRLFPLDVGDRLPIDEVFERGIDEGRSLDDMEHGLIHASANGWVEVDGSDIVLTTLGYLAVYAANDNRMS